MRVLYLCAIAGIGGAERSLLDLLGRLPRDQVTPVLLVPAAGALVVLVLFALLFRAKPAAQPVS